MLAVALSAPTISIGVAFGKAWRTRAATPAVKGQEKDVPDHTLYPVGTLALAVYTLTPIAITSGLMRPSAVGPYELNDARIPPEFTAPAVRTLSPSAGAISVFGWPARATASFPAEFTTMIPLATAISAARVITVVFPSMSLHVQLVYGASYVR